MFVVNTFSSQNLFARTLSQLSPGATGGTLQVQAPTAPAGQVIACVKFVRINVPGLVSTVGGYTY